MAGGIEFKWREQRDENGVVYIADMVGMPVRVAMGQDNETGAIVYLVKMTIPLKTLEEAKMFAMQTVSVLLQGDAEASGESVN
jgi:hypothetical protein